MGLRYLFKITTKKNVWASSEIKAKSLYFVCESYKEARLWAESNLVKNLEVKKITVVAEQISFGGVVFSASFPNGRPKKEILDEARK